MLHILNGDALAPTFGASGIPGRELIWREALMAGPAPAGLSLENWIQTRARHLSVAYQLELTECRSALLEQEERLQDAREEDEVVLWFDNDLFCQTNLLYLLHRLSDGPTGGTGPSRRALSYVRSEERALARRSRDELAALFTARLPISDGMLASGRALWRAYGDADPRRLESLATEGDGDDPGTRALKRAMRLHLTRFPSTTTGLGAIEFYALEALTEGSASFVELFGRFNRDRSAYGVGDWQFWNDLLPLAGSATPAVAVDGTSGPESSLRDGTFATARLSVTGFGRSVANASANYLRSNEMDTWLGGVHLKRGTGNWWRDESTGRLFHDADGTHNN